MTLRVANLRVEIEDKLIVKGAEFKIDRGEVVALMGPNGSGKSSTAYAVMGHPGYKVNEEAVIELDGEDIREMTPDERARRGLFLAFQYPVGIDGVKVGEVLLAAVRAREDNGSRKAAIEIKREIEKEAAGLQVSEELLKRDINAGFSGGEKKKMEILQMRMLKPKIALLDETDSGLDIDALKTIAEGARQMAKKEKTGILVITHYQRILKYLQPDRVLIMKEGRIVKEGNEDLVVELEESGYSAIGG